MIRNQVSYAECQTAETLGTMRVPAEFKLNNVACSILLFFLRFVLPASRSCDEERDGADHGENLGQWDRQRDLYPMSYGGR